MRACLWDTVNIYCCNKPVPDKIYKTCIIGATSMNYNRLLECFNFVQNLHPTIKFTYQISKTSLDMNISLKQGILSICIHYKTTDSHSYLDYRSSHNPSTKNIIRFFEFLKLVRVCSNDADFEEKADKMTDFFINRHYPKSTIKRAVNVVN